MGVLPEDAGQRIRYGLYDPTLDHEGDGWDAAVFAPWAAENPEVVAAVRSLGRPGMASVLIDDADSCALYALSRVAETLVLPLQPAGEGGDWLTAEGWSSFIARIGGTFPAGEPFHPFLHEIAEVEPADDPDEPPAVVHEWWPGCMIGSMLLLRAGVTVRAGSRYLDLVVTMTSTLHWAYRRRFRPVWDLSHGWGSNSQWSTLRFPLGTGHLETRQRSGEGCSGASSLEVSRAVP